MLLLHYTILYYTTLTLVIPVVQTTTLLLTTMPLVGLVPTVGSTVTPQPAVYTRLVIVTLELVGGATGVN